MKFSFSTLGCPDYTFDQMIDLAKRNGYGGIEFRIYKGSVDYQEAEEFSRENIKATRKLFNSNGIEIACCSSSIRFSIPDEEERQKNYKLAQRYFEMASDLGCKYVRVFGGPYPINFSGQKSEPFIDKFRAEIAPEKTRGLTQRMCDEWIMESYGHIGEMGKSYGVMPLMETHDDFADGQRVRDIVDGCGSDNFGILWDCLHPFRYGHDLQKTFDVIKDKVHHVHMKDSKDLTPWGFVPALVGEGEMDIKGALTILKNSEYSDYISFEWEKAWFPEVEVSSVAITQFIREARKML